MILAAAPLVAAALGLAHPQRLTSDMAGEWLILHIALLFVFPLVAVGPAVIVQRAALSNQSPRLLTWCAAGAATLYAVCYSTLDVLAGIGAGVLVGQGFAAGENDPQILALQRVAEPFGTIGGAALVCCVALAGYTTWKAAGRAALAGVLFSVVGAWGLVEHHVYWPFGTLTMLCLGTGLWMLARCPADR
ncbi:hypothetical protein AB0B10_25365 [Micromonospora arborensis]|uniref:hypothetical protein n=1 Tax=Micromonospora arborensis TaxID=2116518 RepID=UPI0033D580F9